MPGRQGGRDAWALTGYLLADGEEPRAFGVTELRGGETVAVDAVLELPRIERVELYFVAHDVFGCTAFDSDFGANYAFELTAPSAEPAVLSFAAEGSVERAGSLVAGGELVVHYEPERLPACRSTRGGVPQWNLSAFAQVDGGAVQTFAVTRVEGEDRVPSDPVLRLDAGDELALWFEVANVFGCHAVDDADGALHRFPLER